MAIDLPTSDEASRPGEHHNERPGDRRRVVARCSACAAFGYGTDNYCACCGAPVLRHCEACGSAIEHPIAFYCPHCGTALSVRDEPRPNLPQKP